MEKAIGETKGSVLMKFKQTALHYYLDLLRNKTNHDCGYSLFNILNTWKISRGNKIINEDFSNIDFGYIPLNNIDFGDREHPSSFRGATLSDENYVSGHVGKILCSAISPDNKYILTGGEDHTAILWEMNTGFVHVKFELESEVVFVSFSDDSSECFIGSNGELPVVWDIEQARIVFDFITLVENTLLFKKTLKTFLLGYYSKITYSENRRYCVISDARKLLSLQYIVTDSVILIDMHSYTYTEFYSDNDIGEVMSCSNNGKYVLTIKTKQKDDEYKHSKPGRPRERYYYSEVWNIENGKMVFRSPYYDQVQDAVFSPDNRLIVLIEIAAINTSSGVNHGIVGIFDFVNNIELSKPKMMTEHDFETDANSLIFSPDGTLAICDYSYGYDHSIISTESWNTVSYLGNLKRECRLVSFSPNNRFCVVCVREYKEPDDFTYVFDVQSGCFIKLLTGYSNSLTSMAFSCDSKLLSITDSSGKAIVWNTTTWKDILSLGGNRKYNNDCVFLPKGKKNELFVLDEKHQVVASISDQSIQLFNAETKKHTSIDPLKTAKVLLHCLGYPITVSSFQFSANRKFIYLNAMPINRDIDFDGYLIKFDITSLANIRIIEMDYNQPPYAFSDDHRFLITYMSPNRCGDFLTLIDLNTNSIIYQSKIERYRDSCYEFRYAIFSSNNKFCFLGYYNNFTECYSFINIEKMAFINLNVDYYAKLALFSPDERFLLLGEYIDNRNGFAILFDTNGRKLHEFRSEKNTSLDSIGFSPDSKHCMIQSNKMVRIFDVRSGETVAEYKNILWIIKSIIKARMSSNNECIIYISDGSVIKWNFISGRKRKVIRKMKDKEICPTYSDDLKYGIYSLDDAVRLYDMTMQTYVDLYNVDGVNVINCDFTDVNASDKLKAILYQNNADIEHQPETSF